MDLTDELVSVVTDDLVMRSRPGTGSGSEIYPHRLFAPDIVYVIDGPEAADGYEWYLVDPLAEPCYFGCDYAPQAGWVAAAGTDGERWLAEEPVHGYPCPEPTLDDVAGGYPQVWLHCFGSERLTLDGGVIGVATEGPGWPWQHRIELYGPDYDGPVAGCVDLCTVPWLTVAFDGDQGLPSPVSAVRVTGHFDDPRAEECQSAPTA